MPEVQSPLTCYSQYGEDILAYHVIAPLGLKRGTYVDIGCGHPIEFNNTYLFYLAGWRGLQVDPDISFRKLYEELRPGDRFVGAAVGRGSAALRYYKFSPYHYSTCDKARAQVLMQDPAVRFLEEIEVPTRPLADLLAEYSSGASNFAPDLMSVDVEGLEFEVLQSNDWQRFRPKVLIVEILGLQAANGVLRTPTYRLLRELGYTLKAMTQNSFVFADVHQAPFCQYPALPLGPITGLDS